MVNGDRDTAKRANFIRLAEKRTNAVLEKVRILSNCANTNAYEYSDHDVTKIFSAIEDELKTARAKFATSKRPEFRLSREWTEPDHLEEVVESGNTTE
jgi:hypothetical protein